MAKESESCYVAQLFDMLVDKIYLVSIFNFFDKNCQNRLKLIEDLVHLLKSYLSILISHLCNEERFQTKNIFF